MIESVGVSEKLAVEGIRDEISKTPQHSLN